VKKLEYEERTLPNERTHFGPEETEEGMETQKIKLTVSKEQQKANLINQIIGGQRVKQFELKEELKYDSEMI
jgi:hypothetical protein